MTLGSREQPDFRKLTGLFISGRLHSELSTELNIKGIPRYLLLDKKGQIANENAPRPSDKEALEMLLNLLLRE